MAGKRRLPGPGGRVLRRHASHPFTSDDAQASCALVLGDCHGAVNPLSMFPVRGGLHLRRFGDRSPRPELAHVEPRCRDRSQQWDGLQFAASESLGRRPHKVACVRSRLLRCRGPKRNYHDPTPTR